MRKIGYTCLTHLAAKLFTIIINFVWRYFATSGGGSDAAVQARDCGCSIERRMAGVAFITVSDHERWPVGLLYPDGQNVGNNPRTVVAVDQSRSHGRVVSAERMAPEPI